MNLLDLFNDKYTVIFVLMLVLLVSVWISRTYRNGGFGTWMAPSEGYGTGVIEGMTISPVISVMTLSHDTNAPSSTSATQGKVILNRCEFVQNSEMKYRFMFTTSTGVNLKGGQTPARTVKITIPSMYAANTNTTGMGLTLRLNSPNAPVIETITAPSPGIVVATVGTNIEVTYTPQQTGADVGPGIYVLELTGIKTPTTAPAAPTSNQYVTLETGAEKLIAVNLYSSDSTKLVKIFSNKTYDLDSNYQECRKITTTPLAKLLERDDSTTETPTGSQTVFKLDFALTNPMSVGDLMMIQIPNLLRLDGTNLELKIRQGSNSFAYRDLVFTSGSPSYASFKLSGDNPIAANTTATMFIYGLRTPDAVVQSSSTGVKLRTFLAATVNTVGAAYNFTSTNFLDAGEYTFPAIPKRASTAVSSGSPTSSGTASDGTTYVTSAASSVLISDVKRQMNWAVEAQNEYETAYKALRAATTTTAKTDAQLKYDVAVARRNRLIASHPDSWYDGANWRYGDDGHVRKCVEPSNLSSNEGNCQNIYRLDVSGNLIKSADGNNILLMRKCPWKCNNPGLTGSDACRIDADCLKVTRWATYLPDGTQLERNLLATTRSTYDNIATVSSSSPLADDDIYRRGITRNFRGYGRPPRTVQGQRQGYEYGQSPGLFGTIRDAAGNIIRGIGQWIDPYDPDSNQRTYRHNAYYYEDGSPAATAYLGMYNGHSYEEESPFYTASKPTNYYYTTNYYYADGEGRSGEINDGKSNMPGNLSSVKPYDQVINL